MPAKPLTSPSPADPLHRMARRQLQRFELASLVEGTTLLLLVGVAVPLKHLAGWSAGVSVLGPVHGAVFLAYIWIAVQTVASGEGWRPIEIARLIGAALVPFGGYANIPLIQRKIRALDAAAAPA